MTFTGPAGVTFINPNDDPRKRGEHKLAKVRMPLLQTDYRRLCSPSLTNHDEADGPMAMQPPRICHDTLPRLISVWLDVYYRRSTNGISNRVRLISNAKSY